MKTYRITHVFSDGVISVEMCSADNIEQIMHVITVYENCIPDKDRVHTVNDLVAIRVEEIAR